MKNLTTIIKESMGDITPAEWAKMHPEDNTPEFRKRFLLGEEGKQVIENEKALMRQQTWKPVVSMFEGSKLTKEQVQTMIGKLELKTIKVLSKYLEDYDKSHYIAYQPNNDLFIKEDNKTKIVTQISEYFIKYICNK